MKRFTLTAIKNTLLQSKIKDLDDQVYADGEMIDMASQQLENMYAEVNEQRLIIDSLKEELETLEDDKQSLRQEIDNKVYGNSEMTLISYYSIPSATCTTF